MSRIFWSVLTLAIAAVMLVGCHAGVDVGH